MKKFSVIIIALFLLTTAVSWMGIGFAPSGSAVLDLKAELETIYGIEYIGKETENGTQDMVFEVVPKPFFLTNCIFIALTTNRSSRITPRRAIQPLIC